MKSWKNGGMYIATVNTFNSLHFKFHMIFSSGLAILSFFPTVSILPIANLLSTVQNYGATFWSERFTHIWLYTEIESWLLIWWGKIWWVRHIFSSMDGGRVTIERSYLIEPYLICTSFVNQSQCESIFINMEAISSFVYHLFRELAKLLTSGSPFKLTVLSWVSIDSMSLSQFILRLSLNYS